jgi:TfoX/Sxy family transcriptional regulator of competence genes
VAYDEEMAHRVRELLGAEDGLSEKRMFGGLSFLLHGNLAVAVSGRGALLVRVGPDAAAQAAAQPHAEPAIMRGREMRGWVFVDFAGLRTKRELQRWVARAVSFVGTLPRKTR